jgi:hypothetical protein
LGAAGNCFANNWFGAASPCRREQLVRRGITLSAGVLATALCEKAAGARVSALVTVNTVKAAVSAMAGDAVAGACLSARVLALAEEAMIGMSGVKSKLVLMVVVLGVAIGGAGWAEYGGLAEKTQPVAAAQGQPPSANDEAGVPAKEDPPIATDQFGDPLPEGALARLGKWRFRHDETVMGLTFSANGKILAARSGRSVSIWDAATGKRRFWLSGSAFSRIEVSPDGTAMAVAENDPKDNEAKVNLWDLRSGTKTRTLALPKGKDWGANIGRLCFAPDGRSLALTYAKDQRLVVLDLTSDLVRFSAGGRGPQGIDHFAFTPDGKMLAASVNVNHAVQLWDLATGKLLRVVHELPAEGKESFGAVAFAPDGKMLALGADAAFS